MGNGDARGKREPYDEQVVIEDPAQEAPRLWAMRAEDVAAVVAVEQAAFPDEWPATAFERELTKNSMARYVVLGDGEGGVAGFGGLWLMVDAAHIVSVGVAPEWRRRGYGRAIVHALVKAAIDHGMVEATLEVRESNEAARALYRVYGFYEVGRRKRYYPDNREDAIIMTTEELTGAAYQARLGRLREELETRFPGIVLETGSGE